MAITYDRKKGMKLLKANVKVTGLDIDGDAESDSVQILYPRGPVACKETRNYFEFTSSTCEMPVDFVLNKFNIDGAFELQDVNPAIKQKFLGGTLTVEGTIGSATAVGTPGQDDATSSGTFTGGMNTTYTVAIDSEGLPDTYSVSLDGGTTYISTGTSCTTDFTTVHDGVTVKFDTASGHTSGDSWTIAVTAVKARLERTPGDSEPYAYGAKVELINKDDTDDVVEIPLCKIVAEEVEMGSDDSNNQILVVGFKALQPTSQSSAYVKEGSTSAS